MAGVMQRPSSPGDTVFENSDGETPPRFVPYLPPPPSQAFAKRPVFSRSTFTSLPADDMNSGRRLSDLPSEILMAIFDRILPLNETLSCGYPSSMLSQHTPKPYSNSTRDLALVNRRCRDIVTQIIRSRCTFVVDVHANMKNRGVDFLHFPREPFGFGLPDNTFPTASKPTLYGFDRLQNIHICIYRQKRDLRDSAMNAYLLNCELVDLIKARDAKPSRPSFASSSEENSKPVTLNLTITFAHPSDHGSRSSHAPGDRAWRSSRPWPAFPEGIHQIWWDPSQNKPRAAFCKYLSDFEFMLRPFALLNARCSNISIDLPVSLREHQPSRDFVEALQTVMSVRPEGRSSVAWERDLHQRARAEKLLFEVPGLMDLDVSMEKERQRLLRSFVLPNEEDGETVARDAADDKNRYLLGEDDFKEEFNEADWIHDGEMEDEGEADGHEATEPNEEEDEQVVDGREPREDGSDADFDLQSPNLGLSFWTRGPRAGLPNLRSFGRFGFNGFSLHRR